MELMHAHKEWRDRPADERFASWGDLVNNVKADKAASKEVVIVGGGISVLPRQPEMYLSAKGRGAPLNEWSFGQVARLAGAPPGYLQTLSAETAARALNEGLAAVDADLKLLIRQGAVAAVNGPRYSRVYDADLLRQIDGMVQSGSWRNPPARSNNGSNNAGLYRGQRDMFVFLVNEESRIDDGSPEGLARGFFLWNSEVGARSFGISTFLYRYVCGNHIVWDATDVVESRLRHIGEVHGRIRGEIELHLGAWAQESAREVEAKIKVAKSKILGKNQAEVVKSVVKATGLPQGTVIGAWEGASGWTSVDGAPDTAWGMTQALTRYAQSSKWIGGRTDVDRAAGQLLSVYTA